MTVQTSEIAIADKQTKKIENAKETVHIKVQHSSAKRGHPLRKVLGYQ